jgi:hypothetical protein
MKCSTAGCNQAAKDRGKCWPHRKWGSSGKPKKYKAPVSQRRNAEDQKRRTAYAALMQVMGSGLGT